MDYEPESPPSFSPAVEDFPSLKIGCGPQCLFQRTTLLLMKDFARSRRKTQSWQGGNAAEISSSSLTKTISSKTNRQPFPGRAVSPLFLLRRTKVWQPYQGSPRGEVSPPMTKTNWQPLLPRKGGKPIIPAMRDEDLATLPISTLEGSKPTYPDGERFVAVRETGSNAPGFTDGHNPRPSRLCVDEVPVGNNFPYKESISQEYQASDEVDKTPQQRAGPFPFETPRISKCGGLRANPSPPYEPISTRKVQQHDVAAYTLPGKPNRQLTKLDLGACVFPLLHGIESVANSLPYLGNEVFRNDLILDSELRTSTALTCFFLDGGVTELQPGFNLLRDEYAWKRVPNNVFFNAIRMEQLLSAGILWPRWNLLSQKRAA